MGESSKKSANKKKSGSANPVIDDVAELEKALAKRNKAIAKNKSIQNTEYQEIRNDLVDKFNKKIHSSYKTDNAKGQTVNNWEYYGDFELKNGKPTGKDVTLSVNEGELIYIGPVQEGMPHTNKGESGVSLEKDGSIFIGEWKGGEAIGDGVLLDGLENLSAGEFVHGHLDGKGKQLLKNGFILEGSFTAVDEEGHESSQLHGKGKLSEPSGYSFDGSWDLGRRNGSGIEKFEDGFVCVGEWEEDVFTEGIVHCPDKSIEEGQFNEDCQLHGNGTRSMANGTRLENLNGGYWKDGELFEMGHIKFAENSDLVEFTGIFQNTVPNGHGKLEFRNGNTQEGQLENGEFVGVVHLIVPGRYDYKGELATSKISSIEKMLMIDDFVNGKLEPHGQGKIIYEDGSSYEGHWESGVPSGIGELTIIDRFKYTGSFKDGKFHGKGSLKSLNSAYRFEGKFENGRKCGSGKEILSSSVVLEGIFDGDEAINIKSVNFNLSLNDNE